MFILLVTIRDWLRNGLVYHVICILYCCNVGDEVLKQPRLLLVNTVQL